MEQPKIVTIWTIVSTSEICRHSHVMLEFGFHSEHTDCYVDYNINNSDWLVL